MQNIQWFEAGDHAGDPECIDQRLVGVGADNCRDMGRAEIAVDLKLRISGKNCHRCGHGLVRTENVKVLQLLFLCGQYGPGDCWRRGFEADPKEDHVAGRVVLGKSDGIEWGVDDFDVGPTGLFVEQAVTRSPEEKHAHAPGPDRP